MKSAEKVSCQAQSSSLKEPSQPELGHAYNCKDCSEDTTLCKACAENCHQGHELTALGLVKFLCECSSTEKCQLFVPEMLGKKTKWTGYYVQYGQQHPVNYEKVFINESNIYGEGIDEIGKFTIKGVIENQETVNFKKTYIGAHSVNYSGKLEDNNSIKGKWSIGKYSSDDFYVKIEELPDTYELED